MFRKPLFIHYSIILDKMKIVVDDKIPYIREAIESLADDVKYVSGAAISPADVKDADALVVRTRTRCDANLLTGSTVKFVATATIGFDHIDATWLRQAGIEWMSCPGCNASSVAQYIRSVLLLLKRDKKQQLCNMTLGIVGCGHVGSKVARVAHSMGMRVILCDPPRVESGDIATYEPQEVATTSAFTNASMPQKPMFVDMETLKQEADVITFHVPLTRDGIHKTFHMADETFFNTLTHRLIIINTSRGSVVDNAALKNAIRENKVAEVVIDTWEHEPLIDRELLDMVWIGTPHIAGYSADGKVNADNLVIEGLCRHFGIPNKWRIEPPALPKDFHPNPNEETLWLQLYNPLDDSQRLKLHPEDFEKLRGDYPLRREKL